jgi:outer membrane receptor protein involved in Fe transport
MKINYLGKSRLSVVIVLSAASVAFAQKTKDSINSKDIEQVVLTGVADIAKDRKTPVAVSTIKEAVIVEKLGNQEFPEVLNTTPSVYATKAGGGFGDSRITVRGFDQRNTAVMINGVPVNDMENGAVYWSNWAGLSDVTSAMQVQRGLGSSKLAIASVGGTINVLTRAADKKREGNVMFGLGNAGYNKLLFSYNTGKGTTGWSSSFLMSRTAGSMYADGTEFEGYNYYWALGYQNGKHDFQFTITGAPQWHNQRSFSPTINNYLKYGKDGEPNRKYNENWGYLNGEEYSYTRNYYHKPVMSLNWDYKITDATKLSTVVYASFGRGGGTGTVGSTSAIEAYRLADGSINFDRIYQFNKANNSAALARRSSINSHNWIGAISSLNHKLNDNLNFTVGVDGRYYKGLHYRVMSDFLGATSYKDNTDINNPNRIITDAYDASPNWNPFGGKTDETKIMYNNDGIVNWLGGFGQLEYSIGGLSAFAQGSISNQGFQRVDYFLNTPANQKTEMVNKLGYNVKVGANYNINSHHNVFVNGGYYERQPFFGAVFLNQRNDINPNLENEKVSSVEVGYGFRSSIFNANVNLYNTVWDDIFKRVSYRPASLTYYANVLGLKEVHRGVEVDFNVKPTEWITVNGMFSAGDWFYDSDVDATFIDDATNQIVGEGKLLIKDLKVGDAAQLTWALGADVKATENLKFDATYRYADNLYSGFDPGNNYNKNTPAVKLPSFGLLDLGLTLSTKTNVGKSLSFRLNVNNVLDETYISDMRTNTAADANEANNWNGLNKKNQVYFGFGRTWNASISYKF